MPNLCIQDNDNRAVVPAVLVSTFRHPTTHRTVQQLLVALPDIIVAHPNGHSPQGIDNQCLQPFDRIKQAIADYFNAGHPIIALCASGIVVRSIAPYLGKKHNDPPVIVVAEDGSSVIPLLGGHRGANILAQKMARLLDIKPSITTASDVHFGVALDQPPAGWRMQQTHHLHQKMKDLLAGKSLQQFTTLPHDFAQHNAINMTKNLQKADLIISDRVLDTRNAVLYHPPSLVLGIGCARHCPPEHLQRFVADALAQHAIATQSIAAIATVTLKADEPAIHALSDALDVPIRLFTPAQCEAMTQYVSEPSATVFAEIGCHSVAEAAALACAKNSYNAELIVTKQKSSEATLAVTRRYGNANAYPALHGQKSGFLQIIGTGPGDESSHTFGMRAALRHAEVVVGYDLYLDLVAKHIRHAMHITRPLGAEQERVEIALQQADQGKRVVLLCGGDPGIYALATLAYELIEQRRNVYDYRPQFRMQVLPGITAMQAAAAKLGAPMGHDFLAISLSDLLTPAAVIRARLKAAAEGDFIVSLYNPQSRTRRTLLAEAKDILLGYRPPSTPVAICRNISRPSEAFTITTLADFDPKMVDMLSLVMIGSSMTQTGYQPQTLFTPRGYVKPTTIHNQEA